MEGTHMSLTSTTYSLTLKANNGATTNVEIVHSILPLVADSWTGDSEALGVAGGGLGNWGLPAATLEAGAGPITLEGFTKATKKNDSGTGMKLNGGGSFPDTDLTWVCDKVS